MANSVPKISAVPEISCLSGSRQLGVGEWAAAGGSHTLTSTVSPNAASKRHSVLSLRS